MKATTKFCLTLTSQLAIGKNNKVDYRPKHKNQNYITVEESTGETLYNFGVAKIS